MVCKHKNKYAITVAEITGKSGLVLKLHNRQ